MVLHTKIIDKCFGAWYLASFFDRKTMARKVKSNRNTVLVALFKKVCADKRNWNDWRTSKHCISIINKAYPDASVFAFEKKDLPMAVMRDPALKACQVVFGDLTNSIGIYMQTHCRQNVRTVAFYATEPGSVVKKKPQDSKWWESIQNREPLARMSVVKKDYSDNVLKIIIDEQNSSNYKQKMECDGQGHTNKKRELLLEESTPAARPLPTTPPPPP